MTCPPTDAPSGPTDPAVPIPPKSRRGFASLSPERRREIARKGGAAVLPTNRAFSRDRELSRSAGSKGGKAARAKVED